MRPAACEVVAAVESLYADRLKPFGRILLKRIRELSAAAATAQARETGDACAIVSADAMPLVDPKALRRICETTPQMLRVEPEETACADRSRCEVEHVSKTPPLSSRRSHQAARQAQSGVAALRRTRAHWPTLGSC